MHGTERPASQTDLAATGTLAEAARLMTICNACRYCEGLCAVFPAMEMRRTFAPADLNYLANLCHACGACYDDCQFAPPHAFEVNVPATLARLRRESWDAYVWPRAVSGVFARNGTVVALAAAGALAAFVAGFAALADPAALFATGDEPGAFYRVMPHGAMVALFGAAFLYALLAIGVGLARFWRDITRGSGLSHPRPVFAEAGRNAATLRYLDGGGVGCARGADATAPPDRRRIFHHLAFYGFLLCLSSTSVATVWHYAAGREAPYAWWDLPVVLGTLGGIGITIGPAGLLMERRRRGQELLDAASEGMDTAFSVMLLLTGATGLLLLVLRETSAMGLLLALHLGFVFAFFLTLPYGKFVHGLYRGLALVHYAAERRRMGRDGEP